MSIYKFYNHEQYFLSDFEFDIEAENQKDAYDKAYRDYGPQVEDMYYEEVLKL